MPVKIRTPSAGVIYRKVTFSDANLAAGILLGSVPAGAIITDCKTIVTTAFNAPGTDFWRVGINAGSFEYSGIDVNVGVAGVIGHADAYNLNPLGGERTVYGRYVGSGGAASAGVLHFVLQYLLGLQ